MKMTISLLDRITRTALCACVAMAGAAPLWAGEASKNIVKTEEDTFNNWVDVGVGGALYKGNKAQGQQRTGVADNMFGGINDMHLEQSLGNKWFAKLDGHAIFGNHDYNLLLDISKTDVGYLRVGYKEFRTYYNGMGGFFPNKALPGDGVMINPLNDELEVDRGDVWAELGLRMPNLPEITFRYDHIWRDGTKDSTMWGDTALTGANIYGNVRKIVPAFRNLNEKRDVFALDAKQTVGKTDVGVGARAELINNNDSLNTLVRPGEYNPTAKYSDVKLDRYLTQEDGLKSDTFSTHATTETRFGEKLWLTSAYEFSTLNSDISGSRIQGTNYDSPYQGIFGASAFRDPRFPTLPLAATSGTSAALGSTPATRAVSGYINLLGGAETSQHAFNMNLMWIPLADLSVITGVRYSHEDTDALSSWTDTGVNSSAKAYVTTGTVTTGTATYLQGTTLPSIANSNYSLQKWAENLEIRYTGLKNWAFYARGDWDEDNQNVIQFQQSAILQTDGVKPHNVTQVAGPLSSGAIKLNTFWDSNRLAQKYTTGFNWYPLQRLSFSGQYYHKDDHYSYDSPLGDGYISNQNFNTDNVNFRVTVRPLNNLTLVSRYDYQRITSYVTAEELAPQKSATQTSNMFNECITWTPLDRLYLQGNFSYVLNETNTPASIGLQDPQFATLSGGVLTPPSKFVDGYPVSGPVNLSFKNNYWTAGLGAGFALNDKTDLRADYTYYRANDYGNNDLFGGSVVLSQPYGAGQEEQTVSASIQRQLCRNARLTLKYTYISSRDETSYGYGNFTGSLVSTSVLVRF